MADGNGSTTTELQVPSSIARLNYFYGQLLAQADLKAEQSYHVVLRRLLQRETFGIGTVAGLRVKPGVGAGLQRAVLVEPGLGMDPDGRELLLLSEACLTLADVAIKKTDNGITGNTATLVADSARDYWDLPIDDLDAELLKKRLVAAQLLPVGATYEQLAEALNYIEAPPPLDLPPATSLADFLFDALVGTTYVALRYLERGADPAPGILDRNCCDDECRPTRLRQGATVVFQSTPFGVPIDPARDAYLAMSQCLLEEELVPPPIPFSHGCRSCLTEYLLGAWRGMPTPNDPCATGLLPAVPLARIYWNRYDAPTVGASRILAIDNESFRPLAPGAAALHGLLEAVTQCAPAVPIPPVFVSVEPASGARVVVEGAPVVLTAVASGPIKFLGGTPHWEIVFYPEDGAGGTALPDRWADGPTGTPFNAVLSITGGNNLRLELNDGAMVPGAPTLAAGTYVWRVNLSMGGGTWNVIAEGTDVAVDGEPNPTTTVPTGDGRPGGEFEARFYVSND